MKSAVKNDVRSTTIRSESGTIVRVPAPIEIPRLVRWSFAVFAAVIPFESAPLSFTSSSFSLAKLAGLIFFGCYFLYYNPLSRRRFLPPIPAPLWGFFGYAAVYLINGLLQNQLSFTRIFTTMQLLALFWIASSLLKNDEMARTVSAAFALGAVALALGMLLELPGFSKPVAAGPGMDERFTSLQDNPSVLAFTVTLAATILVGFNLDTRLRSFWNRILLISLIMPLIVAAVRTGSRGGVVTFLVALLVYLLPGQQSLPKLRALILGVCATGALMFVMTLYPNVLYRMEDTYNPADGGLQPELREEFIYEAFKMFAERPFLGNLSYMEEFAPRVGRFEPMDTHNTFLHLLLEVGLFGAVFFSAGFLLCLRFAWKARSGPLGMLPLALMMATLVMNLVNTEHLTKSVWLVLGLSVAAGAKREERLFVLAPRSLAPTL